MKPASGPINACLDRLRRCEPIRSAVSAVRDLRCAAIDRYMRIDTASSASFAAVNTLFDDPVLYEATDYLLLRRYMKPLRLTSSDVVCDIGCGLGRTLCVFARQDVRKCVGIEISRELANKARWNASRLRGRRAPIEIRTDDAALADYDEATVFWMNNPFGRETLVAVLQAIRRSVANRPRAIQIAYIYPKHKEVLEAHPWLRLVHRERSMFYGTSEALYWRSEPSHAPLPSLPVRVHEFPAAESAWRSGGS